MMSPNRLELLPFLLAVAISPAAAQRPAGADLATSIAACRQIRDDPARLACFDRAAGRLAAAQQSGDLVIVDRKAVVERRRRAFGLPAADALAAADVRGAEVKEVTGTIRSVGPTRTPGQYRLVLADGTAWEMVEPGVMPDAGKPVTIRKAGFGGFRADTGQGRPLLVKRVR